MRATTDESTTTSVVSKEEESVTGATVGDDEGTEQATVSSKDHYEERTESYYHDGQEEKSASTGFDSGVREYDNDSTVSGLSSPVPTEEKTQLWDFFKKLASLQSEELGKLDKTGGGPSGIGSLDDLLGLGMDPELAKTIYKEAKLNPLMITRLTALLRCMTGGENAQKSLEADKTTNKKTADVGTSIPSLAKSASETALSTAEVGVQAIRDLKRMLCFTFDDSEISPEMLNAARALDDLDRVLTERSHSDPVFLSLSSFADRDIDTKPAGSSSDSSSKPKAANSKPKSTKYSKPFLNNKSKLVVWNTETGRYEWNPASTASSTRGGEGETKMADEDALAETDSSPAVLRLMELMANHSHAYVKEVERILFFTDLPDEGEEGHEDNLMAVSCKLDHPALVELKEIMSKLEADFTKQLEAVTEQTKEACKEAERVVFFTDLPDNNTGSALVSAEDIPGVVQLKELMSQVETAFAQQMLAAGEQTYQTFKEVERTLLFTDVPDKQLIHAPGSPTNKASQGVIGDLERQFLFTDVL